MKLHLTDSDIFFAIFKSILIILAIGFGVIFIGWAFGRDITWEFPDGYEDYKRGYLDGFRDGENMQCNYGTIKMEKENK